MAGDCSRVRGPRGGSFTHPSGLTHPARTAKWPLGWPECMEPRQLQDCWASGFLERSKDAAVPNMDWVPGLPCGQSHVTKQPQLGSGKQVSGYVWLSRESGPGTWEEPMTCGQVRDDWGRVGLRR